jgi:hypothetical protein
VLHSAHRLAWLYVTGKEPSKQIDHLNGERDDNRWLNLRDVSHRANLENRKNPNAGGSSGFLGVHRHRNAWQARIRTHGVLVRIGIFNTPEEAYSAYIEKKRQLHSGNTL